MAEYSNKKESEDGVSDSDFRLLEQFIGTVNGQNSEQFLKQNTFLSNLLLEAPIRSNTFAQLKQIRRRSIPTWTR